jgi:hypothetical protein
MSGDLESEKKKPTELQIEELVEVRLFTWHVRSTYSTSLYQI